MDITEFIGFFISLLAILFLFGRKMKDEYDRRKHPAEYQAEEEKRAKQLKEFLESLKEDMKDLGEKPVIYKKPSSPKKKSEPQLIEQAQTKTTSEFGFKPRLENYLTKTAVEQRHFQTSIEKDQLLTSIEKKYGKAEIEKPTYEVIRLGGKPRIDQIMARIHSKKDMVINQIIMGSPKGLQK